MGAVTYPDPKVSRMIEERFVPVQLNVSDKRPEVKEAMERYTQVWTPTILFLDEQGHEVRRSVGYIPPEEMIPELWMALGAWHLAKHEYSRAFDMFNTVREKFPNTKRTAEAIYWCGMAAYKRDDDASHLGRYWHEIKERFPESDWWRKAEFIDKAA